MSRRVAINLVAFVAVFILMLWWAVNNIISFDFIERPYQIKGEFAATAGVSENSEVAYLGVHQGTVRSVESETGKVLITMDIDRGKHIPAGSVARIFRKSAVGEPYIDFKPPDDYTNGGPYLEPGTVVPLDHTQVPLEFSELLRSASRVLEAVDPAQTRTLIHELAVALNGRSDALRSLTVDSDALLATFADRAKLLDQLSADSTRLTHTVAEHRGSLTSAITDLADLADSLHRVNPETQVLLDRGSELLSKTADLVHDVKPDLDCVLSDLDEVIKATTTDDQLGYLATTLEDGPTAFNYVWMTRDSEPGGLWVRVDILVNSENPPDSYVPPHDLPAVPEVPPCVSSFSTASARTTGTGPAGDVHPLSAGDAVPALVATTPAGHERPGYAFGLWLVAAVTLAVGARRRRTA